MPFYAVLYNIVSSFIMVLQGESIDTLCVAPLFYKNFKFFIKKIKKLLTTVKNGDIMYLIKLNTIRKMHCFAKCCLQHLVKHPILRSS